ncbi:MAG TPA: hypothetical protein VIT68_05420 [Candidatus Gracilibacteria bacterium]
MLNLPSVPPSVSRLLRKPIIYGGLIFMAFWILAHLNNGLYEFLWGDNLVQFLPGMVHNGRELFAGNVPLLNFHQFDGYESFKTGYYGVLYAPTYIAYAIAHFVFRNDFLLIEILSLFHYVMGLTGFYLLLRRFTQYRFLVFLSALSYVFSAVYINYGTEWWYALLSMAYMPWITYFIIDLLDGINRDKEKTKPTWLSALCLGLMLLLLALGGNAQITFYVYLYEALFALLYFIPSMNKIRWKSLIGFVWLMPFLVLAFSVVLLFADYATESASRALAPINDPQYMIGIKLQLSEILQFFMITEYNHSFDLADLRMFVRYQTGFLVPLGLFNGGGFLLFVLLLPFTYFLRRIKTTKPLRSLFWVVFVLALLAMIMAVAPKGLYQFLARFDVLSQMQHAFKHFFQATFFICFLGGVYLIKLIEAAKPNWRKWIVGCLAVGSFGVLAVNIHIITDSTIWAFSHEPLPLRPHPGVQSQEKMATVGFDEKEIYNPDNVVCTQGGGYQCASLFDWHVYGGYEPLMSEVQNSFLNGVASNRYDGAYGGITDGLYEIMSWHGYCTLLVNKDVYPDPKSVADILHLDNPDLYSVSSLEEQTYIFRNHTCTAADIRSGSVGDIRYHGEGVDVALENVTEDTKLHLKVYKHDEYRAYDQHGKRLVIGEPEHWQTMGIEIPTGTTQIKVRYHAPKLKWLFWFSLILFPLTLYILGCVFKLWKVVGVASWQARLETWRKEREVRSVLKQIKDQGLTIDEVLSPTKKAPKRKKNIKK